MYRNMKTNHLTFDIDVVIDGTGIVESSADISDFYVPDGEVIDDARDLSPQMIADYDAFVETIEDLLIDFYGLELTYFNDSDSNSRYYNFLAKDDEGNFYLKFRIRIRISNHDPHRTKESQKYKKEEKESPELKKFAGDKKLKPITLYIIVNSKEYETYEEAFEQIDGKIERLVEVSSK